MMKIIDLKVREKRMLHSRYVLLKLTADEPLPDMCAGQFLQAKVEGSASTFLRRPISIHLYDKELNELWLLIQLVGEGTRQLGRLSPGDTLNAVLPLGKGFTLPAQATDRPLLVGGGVGIAPMLFLGKTLAGQGFRPTFLLGARSAADLLQLDEFSRYGEVNITTEDGSLGERGFVTQHTVLAGRFTQIYACGPKPMMVAVARHARGAGISCEVSLENKMACGVGACLCCVEDTVGGNLCVCKEGPVFNIDKLLWQI